MGGKYAIPPKWAQAPPPGAPEALGASHDTSKVITCHEFLVVALSQFLIERKPNLREDDGLTKQTKDEG